MTRTIRAIMRHMGPPSYRTEAKTLEKEITVKRRHYIWSEARFVRTMLPFRSSVRISYEGNDVDGKNALDLMALDPPEGSRVRIRIQGFDAAEAMHAFEQLEQSLTDHS